MTVERRAPSRRALAGLVFVLAAAGWQPGVAAPSDVCQGQPARPGTDGGYSASLCVDGQGAATVSRKRDGQVASGYAVWDADAGSLPAQLNPCLDGYAGVEFRDTAVAPQLSDEGDYAYPGPQRGFDAAACAEAAVPDDPPCDPGGDPSACIPDEPPCEVPADPADVDPLSCVPPPPPGPTPPPSPCHVPNDPRDFDPHACVPPLPSPPPVNSPCDVPDDPREFDPEDCFGPPPPTPSPSPLPTPDLDCEPTQEPQNCPPAIPPIP